VRGADLCAALRDNAYPGRGLLAGSAAAPGGDAAVLAYFIMGRSENSRNRIFVPTDDGIRTEARDPGKVTDPSLILYHPVRLVGQQLVAANGDQSDTIRDFLLSGRSFADALRTRTFEPDAPNFTPRISALMERSGSYTLSILKAFDGACQRQFFEYAPCGGVGHFLSTYRGDGSPLPSFAGEPVCVSLPWPDVRVMTDALWGALNGDNKVSLFVRWIDRRSGLAQTCIKNKYGADAFDAPKAPIWK
jgi:IMP cyclohydrolase